MDNIYAWVRSHKFISVIVLGLIILLAVNIALIAQFVMVLSSII